MIPGEIMTREGEITLNEGREAITLMVANTGDRPVQVGSHYHFAEANSALDFDRVAARGLRLDLAAGSAVRFEPGQRREVHLIPLSGARRVVGFNGKVMGPLAVVLALSVGAPTEAQADFAVRDCNALPDATVEDLETCWSEVRAEAEAELDRIWPVATENAGNYGAETELQVSQGAWLAYRDAECGVRATLDQGAPYAEMLQDACRTELTIERIPHLMDYVQMVHD